MGKLPAGITAQSGNMWDSNVIKYTWPCRNGGKLRFYLHIYLFKYKQWGEETEEKGIYEVLRGNF